MALIERTFLRTEVRKWLMERLFAGDLRPGSEIVERELAQTLGVSRTPLREALLQLESEGFLSARPGRGYIVRELDEAEACGLFELGQLLESLALRKAGIPGEDVLDQLEALNEERGALAHDSGNRARFIELDDRWHRLLLGGCPNAELLGVVRLIRNRLYRYVSVTPFDPRRLELATDEHREILRRLRAGDLGAAADALAAHWEVVEERLSAAGSEEPVARRDGREAGPADASA